MSDGTADDSTAASDGGDGTTAATDVTADQETVGTLIDRIPIGRFHWLVLGAIGGMWAAMAISVLGISFTLPIFIEQWNLSGFSAGVLGSASLIGMLVGNTLGGRYADSVGRKRTLVAAITMFSVFTALTALAVGLLSAILLRFLTGIGLGSALVAGASYLTEHLPTDNRGRFVTYLEAFFSVGSIVTVVLAWAVLSALPSNGTIAGVAPWRVFFAAGIAPIVLTVVVVRYLPESPYHLAERGEVDTALERLQAIARYNGADFGSVPETVHVTETPSTGFSRLFDPSLRRTTILMATLWFGVNLSYYGIFTWLPNTVTVSGFVANLYRYLLVVAFFQLAGQLTAAYLIEVLGRKWTLGSYLLLGGASTYAFAIAIPNGGGGNETLFSLGIYAMGFTLFGAWAVLYAYTSEVFPTEVRSTGLGLTGSVGKVAATIGPVFFGALAQFGYVVALAPVALILGAVGVGILAFGRETKGETLV